MFERCLSCRLVHSLYLSPRTLPEPVAHLLANSPLTPHPQLCRFYHSLIKLGIVDPADEVGSAEMMHFSLRNARYEEANAVYRVLAMGGRGEGF